MCLVTDAYLAFRQTENVLVPSEVSRIVVADSADGSVVAEHEVPGAVAFTVLPGAVAVGVPRPDDALVVTATDLLTGRQHWQSVVPTAGAEPDEGGFVDRSTTMLRTDDGLAVVTAGRRITVLDGDGGPVRTVIDASNGFAADERLGIVAAFSQDDEGQETTTIVGGGPDLVLPGRLAQVSADDGSLSDLVLAAGSRIRAYDRSTGRELWDVGHGLSGSAVVARGRVYLSTPDGVVAIDGRTGAELWRAPVLTGRTMGDLVTDGHHLLSAQERPDEPGDGDGAERLAGRRRARGLPVRRRRRGLARRPARDPARGGVRGAHAARLGALGGRPRLSVAQDRSRSQRTRGDALRGLEAAQVRDAERRGLARAPREVAGEPGQARAQVVVGHALGHGVRPEVRRRVAAALQRDARAA